jgi:hypothetical protein
LAIAVYARILTAVHRDRYRAALRGFDGLSQLVNI